MVSVLPRSLPAMRTVPALVSPAIVWEVSARSSVASEATENCEEELNAFAAPAASVPPMTDVAPVKPELSEASTTLPSPSLTKVPAPESTPA